jgi:hypothetical protein
MEKAIYLLWRDPATDAAAFASRLRQELPPALRAAGAHHVKLNLADADVKAAVGLRQITLKPQPEALVQVWVDSAIAKRRAGVDQAVAGRAARAAAYLVTESQPRVNVAHPPRDGERTYGFAQIALLRRPARLAYDAWLDVWHNSHTDVANATQSTFEYTQNVVVRPLTPEAPAIDAIVEECFPPAAMTDYKAFFDAAGDEPKFKANLQKMLQSVSRFIDPGTIDVIPTSQYRSF